ncbi:DUF1090 family protein [Salmonella enterica]|nr:DUF1090 family protein [Salmonella enterica]
MRHYMKYIIFLFSMSFLSFNSIAGYNSCEIKIDKIKEQIEYAKRYGNINRLEGLTRALARVNRYCNYEQHDYRTDSNSNYYNRDKTGRIVQ